MYLYNQKSKRKVSFTSSVGSGVSFTTTLPLRSHQEVIYATLAASYIKHHLSQAPNLRYWKVIKSSSFTAKRLAFHLILCFCPRTPSTSDSRIQESCVQTGNNLCQKCANLACTWLYRVCPPAPLIPMSQYWIDFDL